MKTDKKRAPKKVLFYYSRGRTRTYGLRVMSPTRLPTALPCVVFEQHTRIGGFGQWLI